MHRRYSINEEKNFVSLKNSTLAKFNHTQYVSRSKSKECSKSKSKKNINIKTKNKDYSFQKCNQYSTQKIPSKTIQLANHNDQKQKSSQLQKYLQTQAFNLFSQIQIIFSTSSFLSKHQQIRINKWLQKLDSSMHNNTWRQNRNLYLKVLLIMLQNKEIAQPFNSVPNDGPLNKLNFYDIPYPIRQKMLLKYSYLNQKYQRSVSKSQKKNSSLMKTYSNHQNKSIVKMKLFQETSNKENLCSNNNYYNPKGSNSKLKKNNKILKQKINSINKTFKQNEKFPDYLFQTQSQNQNQSQFNPKKIQNHTENIDCYTMKTEQNFLHINEKKNNQKELNKGNIILEKIQKNLESKSNVFNQSQQYYFLMEKINRKLDELKAKKNANNNLKKQFQSISCNLKQRLSKTGQQTIQFLNFLSNFH